MVTASGLLFIGATNFDKKFRAFDKLTGKLLWETVPFLSSRAMLRHRSTRSMGVNISRSCAGAGRMARRRGAVSWRLRCVRNSHHIPVEECAERRGAESLECKGDYAVADLRAQLPMPAGADYYVLLSSNKVSHRRCLSGHRKFPFPEFLAGGGIECPKVRFPCSRP